VARQRPLVTRGAAVPLACLLPRVTTDGTAPTYSSPEEGTTLRSNSRNVALIAASESSMAALRCRNGWAEGGGTARLLFVWDGWVGGGMHKGAR
jgi:hypothetical protein